MPYSASLIFRMVLTLLMGIAGTRDLSAQAYQWSTFAGSTGGAGFRDGPAGTARFKSPRSVASHSDGNIYLTDTGNHTIRVVSPAGIFSTLAGKGGFSGSLDGPGNLARFNSPGGIAVDSGGTVYVADTGNHTIRKISKTGVVTTLAGTPGVSGSSDGTGNVARFFSPTAITLAKSGDLFIADSGNHQIRRITPSGLVTTIAGKAGTPGATDGSTDVALFRTPRAIATDDEDSIYVADTFNRVIRKITAAGNVTTLAGLAGASGNVDAIGSAARFNLPEGLWVNSAKDVYVADSRSIRVIAAADGGVSTLAGLFGTTGNTDGTGSTARFTRPAGLTMASDGNLLLADPSGQTLRKISLTGVVTTLAANSTATAGNTDATGTDARFSGPFGLCVDSGGTLHIADTGNRTIRKITPSGEVSTSAGTAGLTGDTDATGPAARFTSPRAVTLGPDGVAYVADVVGTYDSTIRKITPAGAVTTLAGTPGSLSRGDTLYFLTGLVVNSSGDVFASDLNSIRKITTQGVVSLFAGQQRRTVMQSDGTFLMFWRAGTPIDGVGTDATFSRPSGLAMDANRNLFITDSDANLIRKVTPSRQATTLAGKSLGASTGISGSDDATGSAARFKNPHGVAVDSSGNLYIADSGNHTIRKMSPTGVVTTIGGIPGYIGSGEGIGENAVFNQPFGIAVDPAGNVYVADTLNHRIVKGVPLTNPEIVVEHPDGSHLKSGASGLQFGSVTPATTSPVQILRIHNVGNSPLTITSLTLADPHSSVFTINRRDLPTTLPPNGSGSVSVTFTPNALGVMSESLRIFSDDSDESLLEISLLGTGNTLPRFAGYTVSSPAISPVRISIAKLLSAAVDPDGDALTVTSVAWPATSGGSLVMESAAILFYPSSPNSSGTATFVATITDARGGSVTGNISVTWQASGSGSPGTTTHNPPKLTSLPDGKMQVSFYGIPGRSYQIQRSLNLTSWANLANVTADPTGNVIHIDPSPPKPNGYYRIALP